MKALFFYAFSLCLLNCSSIERSMKHISSFSARDATYVVKSIDSINNFFIIRITRNDSIFKVISKKTEMLNCEKIKVKGEYSFKIESASTLRGRPLTPSVSKYEVGGMQFDDSTIISFDQESNWELYYSTDLVGLCFLKNHP